MFYAERELNACAFFGRRQLAGMKTEDANFKRANSRQYSNGRKCALLAKQASESFAVADSLAPLTIHSSRIAFFLCLTFKMSHAGSAALALASG